MRWFRGASDSAPAIVSLPPTWRPDARAEGILFATYWSREGWKQDRVTAAEDFAYARRTGYMFEPVSISHDETVRRLVRLRSRLNAADVARAFSDSLVNGRLDLRSALGSYGASLRLPEHRFAIAQARGDCRICHSYEGREFSDLNVLNFERFKWGGVRHADVLYALFDLSQFASAAHDAHPESQEPLLRILDIAANAPADCGPNDLAKLIAPHVAGNASQRRVVIECLGYAGILQPASHRGFFEGYPEVREHSGGKNDWAYPVQWWVGQDGVNADAVKFYFPNLRT